MHYPLVITMKESKEKETYRCTCSFYNRTEEQDCNEQRTKAVSLEESYHCTELSSLSQMILFLTPLPTVHCFWIQFLHFGCCSKGNSLVLWLLRLSSFKQLSLSLSFPSLFYASIMGVSKDYADRCNAIYFLKLAINLDRQSKANRLLYYLHLFQLHNNKINIIN